MLAITMKTDPAQGRSNLFHCPIFCLGFPRSRQKPFTRRSSWQAHSLLLLLLSLSGWGCVKCTLYFLALIIEKLLVKTSHVWQLSHPICIKSLAPKMVVCLSPYCMINNSSLAKDFFLSHILHAKAIPF